MKRSICLLLLLQILRCTTSVAQAPEFTNIFSRLQQYPALEVAIETDLKQLKSAGENPEWQPGVLKIIKAGAVDYEQKIQIKSRGHMRKKTCDFPPVKIRFFEGDLANDSLEDVNELKLVVACRNSDVDDQLVMKECLVYQLYNLITDESFRVKPAKVHFESPGKSRKSMESTAFFIESEKELASRLGGRPLKPRIISPTAMDSVAYDRMCLFQFMIGNTDWGAYTRHNMKVVAIKGRQPIAVPYDFDYAGLVEADYAIPSPDIPIQNVRDRYYLGLCRSTEHYNRLFKAFLAKQDEILARCEQETSLTKTSRLSMRQYLEEFFKILQDSRRTQFAILENCDKRLKK